MLFIRSFPCQLSQTDNLAEWLEELVQALEIIPYHKLRFLIHEAFVNACKYSGVVDSNIIVVIRKSETLEITITDPGNGFSLPDALSLPEAAKNHFSWKLASDRNINVFAEVMSPDTLHFILKQEQEMPNGELLENHRGLISILKATQNLSYHFVPNSFNYLKITY